MNRNLPTTIMPKRANNQRLSPAPAKKSSGARTGDSCAGDSVALVIDNWQFTFLNNSDRLLAFHR